LDVLHPERFGGMCGQANTAREGWVHIDDELVVNVRPEDVFGEVDRDDRCAYLLFYERVNSTA